MSMVTIFIWLLDRNGNYTSVVREAFIPDEESPKIEYATFIDPEVQMITNCLLIKRNPSIIRLAIRQVRNKHLNSL